MVKDSSYNKGQDSVSMILFLTMQILRTKVNPGIRPQMSRALENHANNMIGTRSMASEAFSFHRYALSRESALSLRMEHKGGGLLGQRNAYAVDEGC